MTALARRFKCTRCALVPATGFFELEKRADGKQPYRFQREDLEPFAFAGLWEFARIAGNEILSATIIVSKPNPRRQGGRSLEEQPRQQRRNQES